MSEILNQIDFNEPRRHGSFEYDADSGFLRTEDGAFLLFRAEAAGKSPSLRTSGDIAEDQMVSYGNGLYTGNTPESVAPYTWTRPDNVINAYLTPPLVDEHVYNHAHLSHFEAAKSHADLLKQRRFLGWRAVSESFDAERGGSLLATIDAGFDIAAGQKILSNTRHLIPPRWGIWRGEMGDLTHIGAAEAYSRPYGWAVHLAGRSSRK